MGTKLPPFQFDDMLHGADLMAEAIREEDFALLANCIRLMGKDLAQATGTAAQDVHTWLFNAEIDPANISAGDVELLRDLLRALAVDYATAQAITTEKAAQIESQRNRDNAKKRAPKLPEAQAEATKRWRRAERLGDRVTKQKMANDLERDGYGAFSYLVKNLQKPE